MTTSNSDMIQHGLSVAADLLDTAEAHLDAEEAIPEEVARTIINSYRAALTVIVAADNLIKTQEKTIEAQEEQIRDLSK